MKEKTVYVIFGVLVVWLYISAKFVIQWNIFNVRAVGRHKDVIETPGCRMPHFDIFNYRIQQYMHVPVISSCQKPLTRTSDNGANIVLNMGRTELWKHYKINDFKEIHCNYTEIQRKTDLANTRSKPVMFDFVHNRSVAVPPGIEFIRVDCRIRNKFYKDYHFFVVDKEEKAGNMSAPVEQVSVMILGLDGLSHLNFLRQMVDASLYIRYNLTHTEFWGYNKVGDNTYPNLVPMLSGLDEGQLQKVCLRAKPKRRKRFYDDCPFVWKRYKEKHYRTVFAEDTSLMSLFNYERDGFDQPPTDYYFRPMILEMDRNIAYNWYQNLPLCKGGRTSAEVFFELIRKFIPLMRRQQFFSFLWSVSLTHDYFNTPVLLDPYLVKLFDEFERADIFNTTVIFLVSDHGLRWSPFRKTYQGLMEERLPLLIALYPKWFKQKYAQAVENLDNNSKRLTTHFDLYETLVDLLDLRDIQNDSIVNRTNELKSTTVPPRGISLFLPIPETRTCEMAGIASHWCTCHSHQDIPTSDARVQRAARYTVEKLNDRLIKYPQCGRLHLDRVREAYYVEPIADILTSVKHSADITVQVWTLPGMALFESTVRITNYSISLTGTISRLNLYGNQSSCIKDANLEKYCYCSR